MPFSCARTSPRSRLRATEGRERADARATASRRLLSGWKHQDPAYARGSHRKRLCKRPLGMEVLILLIVAFENSIVP